MTTERSCQVCAKPIAKNEMCFKKEYRGKTYFACCPICFSILQKKADKHVAA